MVLHFKNLELSEKTKITNLRKVQEKFTESLSINEKNYKRILKKEEDLP